MCFYKERQVTGYVVFVQYMFMLCNGNLKHPQHFLSSAVKLWIKITLTLDKNLNMFNILQKLALDKSKTVLRVQLGIQKIVSVTMYYQYHSPYMEII